MLRKSVLFQAHSTTPGSGCRHRLLVGSGSDLFESFVVIFGPVPYTRLSWAGWDLVVQSDFNSQSSHSYSGSTPGTHGQEEYGPHIEQIPFSHALLSRICPCSLGVTSAAALWPELSLNQVGVGGLSHPLQFQGGGLFWSFCSCLSCPVPWGGASLRAMDKRRQSSRNTLSWAAGFIQALGAICRPPIFIYCPEFEGNTSSILLKILLKERVARMVSPSWSEA